MTVLQTNAFCINEATEQALAEFLSFVGERFKGYDVFMGFPAENQRAVNYLSEHGFECIEDDFNNTAFLDKCNNTPESREIIRIDKENYGLFRILHSQIGIPTEYTKAWTTGSFSLRKAAESLKVQFII